MTSLRGPSRTIAVACVLTVAAGGISTAEPAASLQIQRATTKTLLGIAWQRAPRPELLTRLDPASLRPADGRRVPLRSAGSWAFSPDGARIAFASHSTNVSSTSPRAWIRLVDPVALRKLGDVALGFGWTIALAWPGPDRLIVLQQTPTGETSAVVLDPLARRVVTRRLLDGRLLEARRTARELVLLLGSPEVIGPTRLAVVDGSGGVRAVELSAIPGGSEPIATASDAHAWRERKPGLAVDPAARRAYVVADTDLVAAVELDTLAVSYRRPSEPTSLLTRLRNWLEPAAYAKTVDGSIREARWLGGGKIAVSGTNHTLITDAGAEPRVHTEPAGLQVIDVEVWTGKTLDTDATYLQVAGGLLFATGFRPDWIQESRGIGMSVYDADGHRVLELFNGRVVHVAEVYDGRAYVRLDGSQRLTVVELASGRVVGSRATLPRLVRDPSWLDG
jgi:hypothetical protein